MCAMWLFHRVHTGRFASKTKYPLTCNLRKVGQSVTLPLRDVHQARTLLRLHGTAPCVC